MPAACSSLAAAISATMSVTFFTASMMSSSVLPDSSTSSEPALTFCTESPINSLISFAAVALRCARLRTSVATTAKPRPCSPALAASGIDFLHRCDDALNDRTAFLGVRAGVARELVRLTRAVGVLLHGRRHLLHARSGLFERSGLFLSSLAQIVIASRDLHGTR